MELLNYIISTLLSPYPIFYIWLIYTDSALKDSLILGAFSKKPLFILFYSFFEIFPSPISISESPNKKRIKEILLNTLLRMKIRIRIIFLDLFIIIIRSYRSYLSINPQRCVINSNFSFRYYGLYNNNIFIIFLYAYF